MIHRKDYEIRDQEHLMEAEGTTENKPEFDDIVNALSKEGYFVYNIDISYDNLMGFWRWYCEIRSIRKETK